MEKLLIFFCGFLAACHGASFYNTRIINGEEVSPGEIPYSASLQMFGAHFCGGSIINEYWVVTAGHCVQGQTARYIQVVVGTVYYKQPLQTVNVAEIHVHQNYTPSDSYRNDIALIKVIEPIKFNELVQPIELSEQSEHVETNSRVVVSGWGITSMQSGQVSTRLLKAEIHVANPDYCKKVMEEFKYTIYPTHLCAYHGRIRRGECKGDSGGPLTLNGKLVGIVSWSIKDPECGSLTLPGVFTRATEYIDWIKEHTKN